ncbi:MAG: hypothetical protein EBU01_13470, partial [Crocinitomicaceae bacterium]|nr:hypothetical protein [Crocinitomicaceae bacterium]
YYRYNDPNFSIENLPLNTKEEQQLKEALLTLSRFKGMQQFNRFRGPFNQSRDFKEGWMYDVEQLKEFYSK